MFNPYFLPYSQWTNAMLSRKFPVSRVNRNGIPKVRTISVTTVGNTVVYQICPWVYKQLCNDGLMLLHIQQTPTAGAGSAAFTVSIQTTANPPAGSVGTPLINGIGGAMTSNKVVKGNYLLVYFNKCDGIFQVVNDLPLPTDATAEANTTEEN